MPFDFPSKNLYLQRNKTFAINADIIATKRCALFIVH